VFSSLEPSSAPNRTSSCSVVRSGPTLKADGSTRNSNAPPAKSTRRSSGCASNKVCKTIVRPVQTPNDRGLRGERFCALYCVFGFRPRCLQTESIIYNIQNIIRRYLERKGELQQRFLLAYFTDNKEIGCGGAYRDFENRIAIDLWRCDGGLTAKVEGTGRQRLLVLTDGYTECFQRSREK